MVETLGMNKPNMEAQRSCPRSDANLDICISRLLSPEPVFKVT